MPREIKTRLTVNIVHCSDIRVEHKHCGNTSWLDIYLNGDEDESITIFLDTPEARAQGFALAHAFERKDDAKA